jgi:negative regulator of flagellin synthesis FlgM
MSINIKRTTSKPAQPSSSGTGSTKKSSGSKAQAGSNQPSNDRVDLTDGASRLQQIEQSLADIPVVDSGRVDAISQSIDDGQYVIDNEKIADQIIKNERALHERNK